MNRLWIDLDCKPGGLLLARRSLETSPSGAKDMRTEINQLFDRFDNLPNVSELTAKTMDRRNF